MRLVWREPIRAESRPCVADYPCECAETVYELCRAAGQAYIRWTRRDDEPAQVHETYRWRFKEAHAVWMALLEGRAR